MVAELWFLRLLCFLLHASMHLSTRSNRLGKETFPAGKLGCPQVDRTSLPDQLDARPSFQHPQDNLGHEGGAGRGQPSKRAWQQASLLGSQLRACLHIGLLQLQTRIAPKKACPSDLFLATLALRSKPDSFRKTLPPCSLTLTSLSLST